MKKKTHTFKLLKLALMEILSQRRSAVKIKGLVEFLATMVQRNGLSQTISLAESIENPLSRFQAYAIVIESVYQLNQTQAFLKLTQKSPRVQEWAETIVYFAKQQPPQPGMLEMARWLIDFTGDSASISRLYARMLSVSDSQALDMRRALYEASQVTDLGQRFETYHAIRRSLAGLPPALRKNGLHLISHDLLCRTPAAK